MSIFLAAGLVSSQPGNSGEDSANDNCVRCHVAAFELFSRAKYRHTPAFERQCVTCHLREGARAKLRDGKPETVFFSGALVSQETLWAKKSFYPGSPDRAMRHMVDLGNLVPAKQYRFRIVLSESRERTGRASAASSWFGLAPQEVASAGKDRSIKSVADLSSLPEEVIESPLISCPSGSRIVISWQTKSPIFARLELQEIAAIGSRQLPGIAEGGTGQPKNRKLTKEKPHGLLRDPAELAIDACYTCHPLVRLGSSHPVRLYANGKETEIPEDLPTIDGMMTCVTCHDPHGSNGKQLVREKIKTKLCVACHRKFKNKSLSTMFD